MPPPQVLNNGETETDPTPLWDWLERRVKKADAVILSLDSLFYGGLVPSRSHNIPADQLTDRLNRLEKLTQSTRAPVYAFGTIMRSSVTADSFGHPGYFENYGNKLYRLSTLADKVAQNLATAAEKADYDRILAEIPTSVLDDYHSRRRKNQNVLLNALSLAETDRLTYIAIGRDDTAPYSFSKMELRELTEPLTRANQTVHRADTYPGADEIGALLLARAVLDLKNQSPQVAVLYGTADGPGLIPRYEDVPLQESTAARLRTLGANQSGSNDAQIILLLHTPPDTFREAAHQTQTQPYTPQHNQISTLVQTALTNGQTVALADIAYVNGADDALMRALQENNTLSALAAYSGWNTAGNSIGTALAHSALYHLYSTKLNFRAEAHQQALYTRIIEDWAYQSGIRQDVRTRHGIAHGGSLINPAALPDITWDIESSLNHFTQTHLSKNILITDVTLPWNRLFDIRFRLEQKDG